MATSSADLVADASWGTVRAAPDVRLAHALRSITGWLEAEPAPVRRVERPPAGMAVILSFGPALHVTDADGVRTTVTSFVVGLQDTASLTEHDGRGHGVQLDLTAAGAYALFGTSVAALRGGVQALGDTSALAVDRIVDRLLDAPNPATRMETVHEEVTAAIADGPCLSPEIAWADAVLRRTAGGARIGALADELGWSGRRLVDRFAREIGTTPKAFARLLRFRRAHDQLVARPATSLATLAADCGYADQPHFTRDFRAFAGCTPTELVAEVLAATST